jgi:hypothetical protein
VATTEVPIHYLPQVTIGMNIINIMEAAIFVQAVYRKCNFTQLKHNTHHNNIGHFKRATIESTPIECGFMFLYSDTDKSDILETIYDISEFSEIHVDGKNTILDLGYISDDTVNEQVMGDCVNKSISVDYSFRYKYNERIFNGDAYTKSMYDISLQHRANKHLKMLCNKYSDKFIVGVIPYKLLSVYVTPVKKNESYIEESMAFQKAQKVLSCINDHYGNENRDEVSKSVRKYKL